jgi:hypothetical protein
MVLTSKARPFLPLGACRPINALAGIPLGLFYPSGNRLCGRLELARQLLGRASRSHQIDHLSPELRRISGSATGHQTPQKSTSRVSTQPGQLHPDFQRLDAEAHQTTNCAAPPFDILYIKELPKPKRAP